MKRLLRRTFVRAALIGVAFASTLLFIWALGEIQPRGRGHVLDLLALTTRPKWMGVYFPTEDCPLGPSLVTFFGLGTLAGVAGVVEWIAEKGEPSRSRDLGAAFVTFAGTLSLAHLMIRSRVSPIAVAWRYVPQGIFTISPTVAGVFYPTLRCDQVEFSAERTVLLFLMYCLASVPASVTTFARLRRLSVRRTVPFTALLSLTPLALAAGVVPVAFVPSFSEFFAWDFLKHALATAFLAATMPVLFSLSDGRDAGEAHERMISAPSS